MVCFTVDIFLFIIVLTVTRQSDLVVMGLSLCRHMGEGTRLQNDLEALRELLATYEQSIQRKDQVISNLTAGLQHHRNRMEVQRSFTEWKVKHNDVKREVRTTCCTVCLGDLLVDFMVCFLLNLVSGIAVVETARSCDNRVCLSDAIIAT